MPCRHPAEELMPVYDGTTIARADRRICALCGELVYCEAGPVRVRFS